MDMFQTSCCPQRYNGDGWRIFECDGARWKLYTDCEALLSYTPYSFSLSTTTPHIALLKDAKCVQFAPDSDTMCDELQGDLILKHKGQTLVLMWRVLVFLEIERLLEDVKIENMTQTTKSGEASCKVEKGAQCGRMYPHATMVEQGCTPETRRCTQDRQTHTDCRPGSTETVQPADTQCVLSEKWDTLRAPDPQPLTNPFKTAFLLLSEADKFVPLVSKQSPPFFCHSHQWKKEVGGERQGGRNTSAPHCRNYANVLCVRAPGTGRLGPAIL